MSDLKLPINVEVEFPSGKTSNSSSEVELGTSGKDLGGVFGNDGSLAYAKHFEPIAEYVSFTSHGPWSMHGHHCNAMLIISTGRKTSL